MFYKKENGWKDIEKSVKKDVMDFSEGYKEFLDIAKTEREVITYSQKMAEANGFIDAESMESLKAGDKVFYNNRGKNLILAIIGKEDILKGANFVVSHVDSPRLDLKQNPLCEDSDFALLKTHYYGGIKKYQWASRALSLHGVVALKDGRLIDIVIGEDPTDPVFVIPDLLPHLDKHVQRERKANEVLKGEEMKIIVGSTPTTMKDGEMKEHFKYTILKKLNDEYGIVEEDFISAELQLVPSEKARDIGLDRAIVGAYGHDDRICGYTSMVSMFDLKETPRRTSICYLADKEEVGSMGSTGLQSRYLDYFMGDIIYKILGEKFNDQILRKVLWNSHALSSDVNAGLNPLFKSVHDEQNASKLGYGIVLTKYTGSGGKGGSSDADAEYIAELRSIFDDANIKWQTGMLGKVDEGGGGTVAMFLAHYGIRTIDAGAAILSMHSPMELASKYDVYEIYRAYKVFYNF
ncbi:MAG: aminopeptidase [Bacteroidetes bacterium 4572_77]|nr:MAG: aminopeptidase [Bacteroidetes bacterium 4572_77]